jgi:hypothetical protein
LATPITLLAPQMAVSDELPFDTSPYNTVILLAAGLQGTETVNAWVPTPDNVDSLLLLTLTALSPMAELKGCAPLVLVKSQTAADVGVFAYVN